jgi:hypothetical protein
MTHFQPLFFLDPHSERAKVHMQKIQSDGSSPYDDCFQVEYTPQTVGNHQIEIDYADEPISGSPFTAKAYDSKCAKLYPVEGCVVGRPATFISASLVHALLVSTSISFSRRRARRRRKHGDHRIGGWTQCAQLCAGRGTGKIQSLVHAAGGQRARGQCSLQWRGDPRSVIHSRPCRVE